MIFLKCLAWSAGIGLIALAGYLIYRVISTTKRTTPAPASPQTAGETPAAGVTSPPRAAAPAGKQVPWLGLTVLTLIVLTVFAWAVTAFYGLVVEDHRLEAVRVEASQPRWGEIQKLTLTAKPICVEWPNWAQRRDGGTRYNLYLADPEKDKGRKGVMKSGTSVTEFGIEKKDAPIVTGEDLFFTSEDGSPLEIIFWWEKGP